ncbi:uncharacterized protein C1orf115 [Cynoglossus semilaevis]|uniref:uncharacterized protein C1orf115 n=1 Tax=Cynoglossus semilaevis TaxID=244447 RepID=UPI000495C6EA|nr:uncharacterized protein C1orf115 homolog [Cynoglossus semilaevis]
MGAEEKEEEVAPAPSLPAAGVKKQKSSKEVYFSVLPDRYVPLIEEEEEEHRRRKKEKKKRKQKKWKKNIGKALRFSLRSLLLGLQNMAMIPTSPFTAATTLGMELNRKRN